MLRAILNLFSASPQATLSSTAIAASLDISPALVEHMLQTLVRSGRLTEVELCDGCSSCALRRICVGGVAITQRGYQLRERNVTIAAVDNHAAGSSGVA